MLSLLSPARDKTVAFAAVQAGADAIYIGAPAFGARQAAGNSLEDLEEVVQYAHTYGVQVLVTLNTLLHDDEYSQAVALARALYRIGVDALIIQDLHLLDFDLPPIRLHASTQCDNRTPEHVARLRDMGFKRVVLARELGIEEIRAIHEAVPDIELEAFVHGALCVSYSGRCYISEVLAGRSANRGACSQFCRMAYDLLDAEGNEVLDEQGRPIHQRYVLSLQDLDRSAYLHELIEAGVTTFKIEGRLKDADYVTNITAYYRDLLDRYTQRQKTDTLKDNRAVYTRSFVPNPEKTFHRGATDYFLHGRTPHMANWDTPKSTGEHIGEVIEARGNMLRVRLKEGVVLHNGDGLTVGSEGFNVNGVEGNMVKVNKAVSIPQSAVSPLYRNLDVEFTRSLHSERRIPVDVLLRETEEGFELSYDSVFSHQQSAFSYPHEPAKNEAKAMETIRTQLSKLGDTPFVAREVRIESQPYFIPISVLNEWRRQVTDRFAQREKTASLKVERQETASLKVEGQETASLKVERQEIIDNSPLMTCKYCILHELDHCRKNHPYPKDKEPRFLRLRTGKTLRLTFDCKNCQMLIDEC
jgi:putative protease